MISTTIIKCKVETHTQYFRFVEINYSKFNPCQWHVHIVHLHIPLSTDIPHIWCY